MGGHSGRFSVLDNIRYFTGLEPAAVIAVVAAASAQRGVVLRMGGRVLGQVGAGLDQLPAVGLCPQARPRVAAL